MLVNGICLSPVCVDAFGTTRAAAGNSFGTTNASTGAAGATGLDEREKELIRMKMENLEATKTIVDREHALHSGGTGAPGGSSGGGGSGGGWGGR